MCVCVSLVCVCVCIYTNICFLAPFLEEKPWCLCFIMLIMWHLESTYGKASCQRNQSHDWKFGTFSPTLLISGEARDWVQSSTANDSINNATNEVSIGIPMERVWQVYRLMNTCWLRESGSHREPGAHHPFSILFLMHLFLLAGPKLCCFIINQWSSKENVSEFCGPLQQINQIQEGVLWNLQSISHLVRNTGDNLDLQLASEEGCLVRLNH